MSTQPADTTNNNISVSSLTDPSQQAQPHPDAQHDDVIHHEQTTDAHSRVIAIGLDHSEYSRHAFDWAVTNVIRAPSDLVILTHCRPVATVPGPYSSMYVDFTDYIGRVEEEYRQESHKLLREYAHQLKKMGVACKAIAMRGDPRENIVRKVKEVHADILILGSRGLGAIKRTLLGSVSDYCVHNCHCAVVIAKKED